MCWPDVSDVIIPSKMAWPCVDDQMWPLLRFMVLSVIPHSIVACSPLSISTSRRF